VRLSGSPLLVTGLAEQAPRPKRIGSLTLPLASFGDPLIAGVRFLSDEKPDSKGHLQSIGTAHENDCSPRQKARR